MFIGHFGVGFGAKRYGGRVSLGTLLMAAQFVDLIWPVMLLLGLERVEIVPGITKVTPLDFVYYPFTHSLVGVLVWALLFGGVFYAFRRQLGRALLLGGLVVSHWVLDLIVHRPDLPLLLESGPKVGLDVWNSLALTLLIEGVIFIGGAVIYLRTTRASNKVGSYGTWGLMAFLAIVYLMNLFGPPPSSASAIGIVGLSQWLLVAWGYWIDRNRVVVSLAEREPGAAASVKTASP